MTNPKAKQLITKYLEFRDKISAIDKEVKEKKAHLNEGLEIIEAELTKLLKKTGTDSFKVAGVGTAFKTKKDYVSIEDWHNFQGFLVQTILNSADQNGTDDLDLVINGSMLHMINKAVSKTVVKEFMEEFETLPPGIKYDVENVIQIRRG